ncbi:hypothetical protein NTE19_003387 [Vibrio fluvialis]|nr:hypothetical protein [Vibrio fluvialis]
MTNTIQLTETAQSVQAAIRPAQFQLDLAKSQLEKSGLSTSTIDTTVMLINQVEQMVIELTNKDFDDYNQLMDQAEALDKCVESLQAQVTELTTKLETSNDAVVALQGQKEELLIELRLKATEIRAINEELKALRALNPDRLKDQNHKQRKELEEKRGIVNEQRLKIRDLTRAVNELKTKNGQSVNKSLELASEVERMQRMVSRMDGNSARRHYKGGNGAPASLEFYIQTYNWGLTSIPAKGVTLTLLDDLEWHMVLRTNFGVDALIRFTDWLSPIIPEENYFPLSRFISNEIIIALSDYCFSEAEVSHPNLCRRVEWAQGVSVLDIPGVSDRHLDSLVDGGFKCLYDITKSVDGSIEAKCKGIGDKAEKEIRKLCADLASKWTYQPEEASAEETSAKGVLVFTDEAEAA